MNESHDRVRSFARTLSERLQGLRVQDDAGADRGSIHASLIESLEQTRQELAVAAEELQAQNEALQKAIGDVAAQKARFQRLFDLAPDPLILTDRLGSVKSANRAAAELLQVPRHHPGPGDRSPWLADDSERTFRAALLRLSRLEDVGEVELTLAGRGEEAVIVAARATVLPQDHDEEFQILWALRDVTARTEREEARRRRAEEGTARAVLEATQGQGRFLLHASARLGGVLDPRAVAERLACLAVDRFGGWCAVEQSRGPDRVRRLAFASAAEAHGGDRAPGTVDSGLRPAPPGLQPVLGSGSTVLMDADIDREDVRALFDPAPDGAADDVDRAESLLAVPLRHGEDVIGALLLWSPDAVDGLAAELLLLQALCNLGGMALSTALAHAEADRRAARAEELGEGRSRAIASLAHEMRTPLNSVLGFADLLLEGIPEPLPERLMPKVQAIRTSARHQADLVNDILEPSDDTGSGPLREENVSLAGLISECVAMVEGPARDGGLALSVGPFDDVALATDRSRLRQVLINLLNNAIKFTPDGGSVTVSVARGGGEIVLSVADTGVGIEDHELPFIFERFWKGRKEHVRPGGSGLGLSVVDGLVRRLGGRVEVDSRPGEGSRFSVRLPDTLTGR